MSLPFPSIQTAEEYDSISRDETILGPIVHRLCQGLGLTDTPQRVVDGSLPVYYLGPSRVLKLYPPVYLDEWERESVLLQVLEDRLPIPTPRLEKRGQVDGWGYVVMSRLHGVQLSAVWQDLSGTNRMALADQLGLVLAELHHLRDDRLSVADRGWSQFLKEQESKVYVHHERRGLTAPWLEALEPYLKKYPLPDTTREVLLHTEVMREHLYVDMSKSTPTLSGIFDFEPTMLGSPAYEFASVGIFFSAGDTRILRRVLLSYGYGPQELTDTLSHQFCCYALLHRYSNLRWYLRRLSPPEDVNELERLALCWWGLGE